VAHLLRWAKKTTHVTVFIGIASYFTAFVVFAIVPNVTQVLWFPFLIPLRRWKLLRPPAAFLFAAIGVFIGFWCFSWVAAHTSLRVALAMVLLPALLSLSNGRERVRRAIAGVSGARGMLRAQGEEGVYDQRSDIQTEYGYLCGDLFGYVVGVFVFARGVPWFWP